MLFNSYGFVFIFLPLALTGFFALGKFDHRVAAVWLMLSSLVFYAWWNPSFLPLLVASVLFNFSIGAAIRAAEARPGLQRAWLVVGIAGDLGVLFYYKYFATVLGFAAGFGLAHVTLPELILPLGISFFTFTQIGYLVDTQQGVARQHDPLSYALFVTLFPHLIAGPILHNKEIMPQFADRRTYRFSGENFVVGLMIFLIGLAKKCLFADPIASEVRAGFAAPDHLTMLSAWLVMLTYSLQLYFDFSGYTDMAIGVARMFNLRFPLNFNSPFKATNIIDYWQRWHMTLTRFLALYLFNPIALAMARRRARRGKRIDRAAQARFGGFVSMVAFPILVTMGLVGVWHGAGFRYLVFGLVHAGYLIINHAWRNLRGPRRRPAGPVVTVGNVLLTLTCVLVALTFFRAPSMAAAFDVLAGMAGLHGFGSFELPATLLGHLGPLGDAAARLGVVTAVPVIPFGEAAVRVGWIAVLGAIVWGCPNTQQIMIRYAPALGRITLHKSWLPTWRPTTGWAIASGAVAAVAVIAIGGTTEFIYFQF